MVNLNKNPVRLTKDQVLGRFHPVVEVEQDAKTDKDAESVSELLLVGHASGSAAQGSSAGY